MKRMMMPLLLVAFIHNPLANDVRGISASIQSLNASTLTTLAITTTGKKIYPAYGTSYSNLDKICRVATTPSMISYLDSLQLSYTAFVTGSEMQFFHRWDASGKDGSGFNCRREEVEYQHKQFCPSGQEGVLDSRCCNPRNYSYWLDYLFVVDTTSSDVVFPVNVCSAFYQHYVKGLPYDSMYHEWTVMRDEIYAHHQKIKLVLLGVENEFYKDLFKYGASDYAKVCRDIIPWFQKNLDAEFICGDINSRDENWDRVVAAIPEVNCLRYYFQFYNRPQSNTYQNLRDYVNNDMERIIKMHMQKYPGKKMYFAQTEFKNMNPVHSSVAHALIVMEEYFTMYKLNIKYNDVMVGLCQFNLKHLFDKTGKPLPQYYSFRLLGGIDQSMYCNADLPGAVTFASQTADGYSAVVFNPSAKAINIDRVTVDGAVKKVKSVEGYYGSSIDARTIVRDNSLTLPPYSFKKIIVE